MVNHPVLTKHVKQFSMKHSRETSRFCHTRARHQKAAHLHAQPARMLPLSDLSSPTGPREALDANRLPALK